jgi:hypothetical protein
MVFMIQDFGFAGNGFIEDRGILDPLRFCRKPNSMPPAVFQQWRMWRGPKRSVGLARAGSNRRSLPDQGAAKAKFLQVKLGVKKLVRMPRASYEWVKVKNPSLQKPKTGATDNSNSFKTWATRPVWILPASHDNHQQQV